VAGVRSGQVLVATTVEIVSDTVSVDRLITGSVTDFFSVGSFRVRGAPIDATNSTLIGGELNNLGDGAAVLLRGQVSGGAFVAREVEFVNPGGENLPDLSGNVRTLNGRAYLIRPLLRILVVNRVVINWDAQTIITGDLANVGAGQRVQVSGVPQGDGLYASRIAVLPD
jgi:hypothetical protein